MSLTQARELREKRFKLVKDARELLDKENRSKEDVANADKFMAEADAFKVDIDRIEKLEAAEAEMRNAPPAENPSKKNKEEKAAAAVKEYRHRLTKYGNKFSGTEILEKMPEESRSVIESCHGEYWGALKSWLISGDANISPETRAILNGANPEYRDLGFGSINNRAEFREMGTGGGNALQGSGGGYFVPVGFVYDVEQAMKFFGEMLQASTIFSTATGQPLPYPTSNDTGTYGERVGENKKVSDADLNLGNIIFNAIKYDTKMLKLSIELLQDSAFNLENYAKEQFSLRLGRILNQDFTIGSGPGHTTGSPPAADPMPTGIITAATDSGQTVIGDDSASPADPETQVGYTDLVNLEHSVDRLYRRGAAWMFHDTTLRFLKTLKDKYGRPLWLPGLAVNAPDTILSYPYFINNEMDELAAGNKTVLFGQLKKYMVRAVRELAVLRLNERFAEYGQVAFIAFARYDGNLLDAGTHPVKYLTQDS